MERDKPKKLELVGQTLLQLPWKQKRGDLKKIDSFYQTSWNFVGISTVECGSFWGSNKFKMAAVAMVPKVQKMLNSLQSSQTFAVMFPVTSTSSGNKKGGFKFFLNFFHQTSWNIVGIFTVVCGSFWRVDRIQNGTTMETEVPK